VRGARLLIIGDGPERQSVELAAARRGIGDAVTLAGAVDPADIPSYLAQMDVAVAPYPPLEDFYFSPLKVLEYMAGGIAIAASAIGQVAELIADGRTGLLCAPGDAEALAEALRRLHESPSLRQRLGAAAREQAVRGHSWDAVVRQILELAAAPAVSARRRTG
jgi:glycosyltransferase involved in cell wall biosynthesis